MSGHNKWTQIKRQKGAVDAKKSKLFGKFARMITQESKRSDGAVSSPALRALIEKAKSINMPNDNIDRAIKRGTDTDTLAMESVIYEGYGPGGAALIIEGLTDNKNRTSAEIKHLLSKQGAVFAASGAAMWAFQKNTDGYVATVTTPVSPEEKLSLLELIDLLKEHDDINEVYTNAK